MTFREDMKNIEINKIELVNKRTNIIDDENYKKLYNYFSLKFKNNIAADIKNRNIHYDYGFFGKKNPRYEDYYSMRLLVYPDKIREFQTGINVYDKNTSGIYGGEHCIYLETSYLEDVEKSLLCLLIFLKEDEFDHILVDSPDSERGVKSGYIGKDFSPNYIDSIMSNMKEQWEKNIDTYYTRKSYVDFSCDIIVQINCDWDGNTR